MGVVMKPSNLSNLEKMKLILTELSQSKLPYQARLKLVKICSNIITDDRVIKFALNGFKKVFVEQLKSKKLAMDKSLYYILQFIMCSHSQLFASQPNNYLKICLNQIGKIKGNAKMNAIETLIDAMIYKIGLKDNKQTIKYLNEFIECGCIKKKKIKEKSWKFLYILIERIMKENKGKIHANVLNVIEKGIKQSLSNNDDILLNGCYAILDLLFYAKSCNLTFKLFGNMAAKKQEKYYKMYPISTPVWFHKLNKTKPGKKKEKTLKYDQS